MPPAWAPSAALTVAAFGSLTRRRQLIGTGITLLSLGLVGLSLVRHLAPAVACCVLVGFGLILFFSTSQAVVR